MKITLIATLGFTALVGCVSTAETYQSSDTVCSTEYRPHLCLATIGGATYGGYGPNRCFARKHLLENLERLGINAPENAIECGEVAQ